MKLLTNLIFEPKGVHDPALTYSIKDTVMSPDGSKVYFALRDVPSGIALTDEDYWMLQIDLSSSKNAMDEAVAAFSDYAKIVGTRVKGETAKATGNPATFLPDAGSLLQPVTVMEPQQEGSGDPYPAGGGRNLLNVAACRASSAVTDRTTTFDGEYITISSNAITLPQAPLILFDAITLKPGTYTLVTTKALPGMLRTNGAELYLRAGNTSATFTLSSEFTFDRLAIDLTEGAAVNETFGICIRTDDVAEYAPYSNIRPFIGYDKLDLNHAGKNLLPNMATTQTINGVTFTVNADGSITANGTATDVVFFNVGRVLLESGVSYVLSGCPAGGNNGGNFLMYVSIGSEFYYDFGSSVSFEGTGETRSVFIQVKSGATVDATFYPMIRLASDPDATYAPYTNTLHTVQIGQTVYGFRYEWLTGKGWIEWAMVTLTDNHGFYLGDVGEAKRLTVVGVIPGADNEGNGENVSLYCSHYKVNPAPIGSNSVNNAICGYQQDGNVYIRDDRFNTYEEAAAYFAAQNVAGTPVQVCWKLAQPIEIQLTPHIISAVELEQNNTLYGDGTIEVEYVKPLHVSIEERVAAALAAAAQTE